MAINKQQRDGVRLGVISKIFQGFHQSSIDLVVGLAVLFEHWLADLQDRR